MMRTFLRAFFLSVPRHLAILAVMVAIQKFDFSPLPDATAAYTALFLQFLITFFFGAWVFARANPGWSDVLMAFAVFLILGTAMEGAVFLWFTGGAWRDLLANYSWGSLIVIALYALAIGSAALFIRRRRSRDSFVEGMNL